ncbi:MAG: prolipoprotein diacylglyceryl transferase [Oscillibacter sp.]|jgi:phosphatidylglycerol:prolipoprotein diacylglycerol transferase|nr:prolipoprotein diacylglyceryl transferase [Oscillibacter sp.]
MEASNMSPISFPGLFGDWKFTASPVAFTVAGHPVYWYGILLASGVLAGLLLCTKQAHRFGLKEDHVLDVVLWGVPVGILGARTYYVIFYLDLFRNEAGKLDWSRVVAIWDGGMAIYGTVIAVFILAIIYCRRHKLRLGALTDLCVMGLLLGQAIGRWGNFMNREAYGEATTLPWRMRMLTQIGSYIEVHPTFFYESLWNVVGLLLLLTVITKARRFDGENTWFYFLWYGIGRFWIEGLRTDSLYLFNWTLFDERIRVSQALSLLMVLISAFMLYFRIHVQKRTADGLMVNQQAARAEAELSGAADGSPAQDAAPADPEDTSRQDGQEPR